MVGAALGVVLAVLVPPSTADAAASSSTYDAPVTVNYSTAEGDTDTWKYDYYYYFPPDPATSDVDFRAQSGTLTFAAGETSKVVRVQVSGDTAVEANETVTLTLTSPGGATIADGAVAGAVVRFAYAWSGSAAIRTRGGLARVLADMDTAAQHIHVDPNTYVAAAPSILDAWTDERPPLPPRQR